MWVEGQVKLILNLCELTSHSSPVVGGGGGNNLCKLRGPDSSVSSAAGALYRASGCL